MAFVISLVSPDREEDNTIDQKMSEIERALKLAELFSSIALKPMKRS